MPALILGRVTLSTRGNLSTYFDGSVTFRSRPNTQGTGSHSNQVQLNLCKPTLARPKVQRGSINFIDNGSSETYTSKINSLDVVLTGVASLDSYMIEFR